MKVILILFLSILSVHSKENCSHTETTLKCLQYVRNYDGDTIRFNIPKLHPIIGKEVSVRLTGIDTPEIKTKNKCEKMLAKVAKEFVRHLLLNGKDIQLRKLEKGKYFRLLGEVIIDGKSLNKELIHYSLAVPYFGKTKSKVDWCNQIKNSKRTLASEGFELNQGKMK